MDRCQCKRDARVRNTRMSLALTDKHATPSLEITPRSDHLQHWDLVRSSRLLHIAISTHTGTRSSLVLTHHCIPIRMRSRNKGLLGSFHILLQSQPGNNGSLLQGLAV